MASFADQADLAASACGKRPVEENGSSSVHGDDLLFALKLQLSEAGAEVPNHIVHELVGPNDGVSADFRRDLAMAHDLASCDLRLAQDAALAACIAAEELGLAADLNEDLLGVAAPHRLPVAEECKICLELRDSKDLFSVNKCGHMFCFPCMRMHLATLVKDGRKYPFTCPSCEEVLEDSTCVQLLAGTGRACGQLLMAITKNKHCTQILYCANPHCSAAFDWDGDKRSTSGEAKKIHCPMCRTVTCADCRKIWHAGKNCGEPSAQHNDNGVSTLAIRCGWRKCPKCGHMIERRRGDCNFMRCVCGFAFCYKCLKAYKSLRPQAGNMHGKPGCACGFFDPVR